MLGRVPKHWETLPLRDLLALTPQPRQAWQATPPEVILRALALSLIIFNHATEIYTAIGSTWVLMLLAGLTLARFQSGNLFAGRVGTTLRVMLLPVLAAYFAIIGAIHLFWLPVDRGWFLLIGNFGTDLPPQMIAAYWFVCLYAQVIALLALPFLWPWLRQKVAARPFEAGMLVALVFAVLGLLVAPENTSIYQLRQPVFCLQVFALGWAAFYARNARDRLLVSLLVVLIFVVFAQQSTTSFALIVAGSLFAIWGRDIAPAARSGAGFAVCRRGGHVRLSGACAVRGLGAPRAGAGRSGRLCAGAAAVAGLRHRRALSVAFRLEIAALSGQEAGGSLRAKRW